jgi:ribosomal protein S18 acetylase RimI-like enzyme
MSGAPLVREMGDADIAAALALWRTEPGVGIGIGDDAHGLARLLARNPHLSHVALAGTELVATCLAGHDGRRGTLYHVAVAPAWRRQGLARRLVAASLANLERLGIGKCGLLVFAGNHEAQGFWRALGFAPRADLVPMQRRLAAEPAPAPADQALDLRPASADDAPLLARLNWQLIRDEGHANALDEERLAARMAGWLAHGYRAWIARADGTVLGYCLARDEGDAVHIRQLYVAPAARRRGVGRAIVAGLRAEAWPGRALRLECLVGNQRGLAFWRGIGFHDHSLTLSG